MKTWSANSASVEKKWWVVDASGKKLGRLATEIAKVIRGKHRPTFTPHADTGDFVIVINADKIELSGNKLDQMKYYRHSLHFGSLKETSAREMKATKPEFMIQDAVKGMLPKNRLAKVQLKHLKAYAGPDHPHKAQKPEALSI